MELVHNLDGFTFEVVEQVPSNAYFMMVTVGVIVLMGVGVAFVWYFRSFFMLAMLLLGVLLRYLMLEAKPPMLSFQLDATGMVHKKVRYTWQQVGRPTIEADKLALENGKVFCWKSLQPDELSRLKDAFEDVLPQEPQPAPQALRKMMSAG